MSRREPDKMIGEIIQDNYVKYIGEKKERSAKAYKLDYEQLIGFCNAEEISSFQEEHIERYVRFLKEEGNAELTVKRKYTTARSLFKELYRSGLISEDPFIYTTFKEITKKKDQFTIQNNTLSEGESRRIIRYIANIECGNCRLLRDTVVVLMFLEAALRTDEVERLNRENILIYHDKIVLDVEGPYKRYLELQKGTLLEQYLRIYMEQITCHPYLFENMLKQRMTAASIRRIVLGYMERITGKHITPRQLRKTVIGKYFLNNTDIKVIQKITGSGLETVERWENSLLPDDKTGVIESCTDGIYVT